MWLSCYVAKRFVANCLKSEILIEYCQLTFFAVKFRLKPIFFIPDGLKQQATNFVKTLIHCSPNACREHYVHYYCQYPWQHSHKEELDQLEHNGYICACHSLVKICFIMCIRKLASIGTLYGWRHMTLKLPIWFAHCR